MAIGQFMPMMLGGGGGGPLKVEFLGTASTNSSNTTALYSGLDFGIEHPTRRIAILAMAVGYSSFSPHFATVNASTGGPLMDVLVDNTSASAGRSAIMIAHVPLGTTGQSITYVSASPTTQKFIGIYSIIGLSQNSAANTATYYSSTGPVDLTLDVPDGGVIIGGVFRTNNTNWTWSGLDKNFDNRLSNVANRGYSGASREFPVGGLKAITATPNANSNMTGTAASWGP